MEKAVLDFVVEQTNALIAAPTTATECKAAAEAWLASDKGEAANKAYIAELEADIMPLDGLIAFAESPAGAQVFAHKSALFQKQVKGVKLNHKINITYIKEERFI